jgi:hypothetical protein
VWWVVDEEREGDAEFSEGAGSVALSVHAVVGG